MCYDHRYIPYQEEETQEYMEELEEEIQDLSYQKYTAWEGTRRNIDKYIEMLTSLYILEDEIAIHQSRLDEVRNELHQINEEIESLR